MQWTKAPERYEANFLSAYSWGLTICIVSYTLCPKAPRLQSGNSPPKNPFNKNKNGGILRMDRPVNALTQNIQKAMTRFLMDV